MNVPTAAILEEVVKDGGVLWNGYDYKKQEWVYQGQKDVRTLEELRAAISAPVPVPVVEKPKKKVTRATVKSFMARELKIGNLFVKKNSTFDGMVDCVMPCEGASFKHITVTEMTENVNTFGIPGVWFVGSSRDYFTEYADADFIGYEVSNCCGDFIVAMARPRI